MNKKLLISLSLLLALFLASCSSPTESDKEISPLSDSEYIGNWYSDGSDSATIIINKDGTIKYSILISDSVKKLANNKFEAKFNSNSGTMTMILEFSSNTKGTATIIPPAGEGFTSTLEIIKR